MKNHIGSAVDEPVAGARGRSFALVLRCAPFQVVMRFRQKMDKGDLVGSTKKFPITSIVGKDARR